MKTHKSLRETTENTQKSQGKENETHTKVAGR